MTIALQSLVGLKISSHKSQQEGTYRQRIMTRWTNMAVLNYVHFTLLLILISCHSGLQWNSSWDSLQTVYFWNDIDLWASHVCLKWLGKKMTKLLKMNTPVHQAWKSESVGKKENKRKNCPETVNTWLAFHWKEKKSTELNTLWVFHKPRKCLNDNVCSVRVSPQSNKYSQSQVIRLY